MCAHPFDPFYKMFRGYYLIWAELYLNILFYIVKIAVNKIYDQFRLAKKIIK